MICSFFKFSAMKHFYGSKSISWVDFRVVLMSYSFQSVRVDLEGELEKWTKYAQIWKYSKSMLLDFDSVYQWKIAPHPHVSYIFGNILISTFTWSMLNWSFDMKITNILHFEKKCRFLVKSLYFGLKPIVNEVISRFWAFWSNFLYDFTH